MARAHVDPEAWARKVKIRRKVIIILTAVVLLTVGTVWLLKTRILPEKRNSERYAQAEAALAQGNVPEAIDRFSVIWSYRDAGARATELALSQQSDDSLGSLFSSVPLGARVSFGSWEQDGKPENGPEPIEWFVLADDDGRVLLWSGLVLEQMPYHNANTDITWADCSLRSWLNDSFYRTAFTPEEQAMISMTVVENPDNAASGVDGGVDTEDHVYIPSCNELIAYYYFNGHMDGFYSYPTPYAATQGLEIHSSWGTTPGWLRNPGIYQNTAGYCSMGGDPTKTGRVNHIGYGVRPVIWVFAPGRTQTIPEE